jgi:hypothetical protein
MLPECETAAVMLVRALARGVVVDDDDDDDVIECKTRVLLA